MTGVIHIGEKPVRDTGDPKQDWVVVYESRNGGYVGRRVEETSSQIVLTHFGVFDEQFVFPTGLVPEPAGRNKVALNPIISPPQVWRVGRLFGNFFYPEEKRLCLPRERVVTVETIASMPPFYRGWWDKVIADIEATRDALYKELQQQDRSELLRRQLAGEA